MFCPKCAANNLDGASFCRTCGANISLIPQALSGQPAQPAVPEVDGVCGPRKSRKEITLDQSFKNIFMGIAFFIISIVLSQTIGRGWWFWMLLPAFSLMGTGIAQYIRVRERERRASLVAPPVARSFPERANPEVLMPPAASVTEGTTRHLGVEAPTRHLDHERK